MADESLLNKVHDLSDLELAVLLCLVSREHCLISTLPEALDDVVAELKLIAAKTFGLQCVIVDCTASTTLEDFAAALLLPPPPTSRSISPNSSRTESYFHIKPLSYSRGSIPVSTPTSSQIANFVLAKNLDRAPQAVQIQALELLRTHRIFTRTSVQAAPKQFIFLPVLGASSGGKARVTDHLNDFFFIAHFHDPQDGYVNLEEAEGGVADDDSASTESVVKKAHGVETSTETLISETEISRLGQMSQHVHVDIDVVRYQMNIVAFLRMHRAVATGISPTATKHFHRLIRCLAPLHKLDFVTPALVSLATRKIYLHRIRLALPENERSMQWGSKLDAVKALLDGIGPEEVIEDVLESVTVPL